MADLAELTGAGRSDVIPGFTLSPLTLLDYGEAERTFEAWHIARAATAGDPSTTKQAVDDVAKGRFAFGSEGFDQEILKVQNLPYLAWLELRHNHKDITQAKATELLATAPDMEKALEAIMGLAGYRWIKKKAGEQVAAPTGQNSSDASSSPDSPTTTSAG